MTELMTREYAAALVDLLRTLRPSWDARATLDALGEVRDRASIETVTYRAVCVALDPAAATPRALTFPEVWQQPNPGTARAPQPPRMRPGEFRNSDPAPADRRAELIAQAKANIRREEPQ